MIPARPVDQDFDLVFDQGVDESAHLYGDGVRLEVTNGEYASEGGLTKRHGVTYDVDFANNEYPRNVLPLPGGGTGYAFKKQFRTTAASGTLGDARSNFHANLRQITSLTGPFATALSTEADVNITALDGAVLTVSGVTYVALVVMGGFSVVGGIEGPPNRWVVVRADTGDIVMSGYVSDTTSTGHRVIALGSKFALLYTRATATAGIYGELVDPVAVSVGSPVLIKSGTFNYGTGRADAVGSATHGYGVFVRNTGTPEAVKFDTSLTLVGSTTVGAVGGLPVSIAVDENGNGHVVGGTFVVARIATDFNSVTGSSTPSGWPGGTAVRVGITAAPGAGVFAVAAVSVATTGPVGVYTAWLANDHSTVTSVTEHLNLTLLSKPFIDYNNASSTNRDETRDIVYAAVLGRPNMLADKYGAGTTLDTTWQTPAFVGRFPPGHDVVSSTLNNTYPEPIAMLVTDGALSLETTRSLPNVTGVRGADSKDDPTIDWYVPYMQLIQTAKATSPSGNGEQYIGRIARLEHAMNDPLPVATMKHHTVQGGSLLRAHSGVLWSEGPIMFNPPPPTITEVAGAGVLGAGTYTFYSVWNFDDSSGQRWRSAPSVPTTIVKGGAVGATHLEFSWRTHVPTMRAPRSATSGVWTVELYRTTNGGTVPRLELVRVIEHNAASTVTLNSGFLSTDANLADHAVLYTIGELEASPAPPASAACVHGERLFLVDALDRQSVWYSKQFTEGYAPEFSPVLQFRMPDDVVGLASMDGNLLVFTRDAVYAAAGGGYSKTGTGSNFEPQLVASGVGLSNPYSVVVIPAGALFHSSSGMHLLGRDLQVNDISAQTKDSLAAAPMQLAHVPTLKRVYVVLGGSRDAVDTSNRVLVLDYARNKTRWLYHDHASYSGSCRVTACAYAGGVVRFILSRNSTATVISSYRDTSTYADTDDVSTRDVSTVVSAYGVQPDGQHVRTIRVRRIQLAAEVETDNNSINLQLIPAPVDGIESINGFETHTWSGAVVGTPFAATLWRPYVKPKYSRVTRYGLIQVTIAPTSAPDERGPVLHSLTITYTPTGRVKQPGAAFAPTS